MPSSELTTAKPSKGPRARPTRLAHLHETVVVGLALSGLFVGYLAWRLSEGTISIAPASPYVEDALERIVGGRTSIRSLRLGWDEQRRDFVVTATGVSATTNARMSPLTLGAVNLTLNARALLLGRAQITRADLNGLQAVLVFDQQGRSAFGFGTAEEVLALPRQKGRTIVLRELLDSVRQAARPYGDKGLVEAIALRDAQVTIIDPDTNERLSLVEARATITTDESGLVTLQGAGFARELGGFTNVAISSSADPRQRLAVAATLRGLRFARLPRSLQFGPLQRVAGDTVPISGSLLARLGEQSASQDVRAALNVGPGRFQGMEVDNASGLLVWDGARGSLNFENVFAVSERGSVSGLRGSLSNLPNSRRQLDVDAMAISGTFSPFGDIRGDYVRATMLLGSDYVPLSGNLTAQSVYLQNKAQTQTETQIKADRINVVLNAPKARQNRGINLNLSGQLMFGSLNGRPLRGGPITAQIEGVRGATSVAFSKVSVQADRFAASLVSKTGSQAFDFSSLKLNAAQFSVTKDSRFALPKSLALTSERIRLGGDEVSLVNGQLSDLSLTATDLWTGLSQLTGSVKQSNIGLADLGASGRRIEFDLNQNGPASAVVSRFDAEALRFVNGPLSADLTRVSGRGTIDASGIKDGQLAAARLQITNPRELPRPLVTEDVQVSGRLGPRVVSLDQVFLRHRGVDITGSSTIALAPRGSPRIDLAADIRGAFSVTTLLSAWPHSLLHDVRTVIQQLIPNGIAEVSRLNLALPPGMMRDDIAPTGAIDLEFSLKDVTVTYLEGMSAITDVSGKGTLTGTNLKLDLPTGRIGSLALTNGRVEIPQFMPRGAHILIDADVAGDVSDMANEIDRQPLRLLSNVKINPDRLSGIGAAAFHLDIPLKPAILKGDIGVAVNGSFRNARLANTFAGLDAIDGLVQLKIDNQQTSVSGKAVLAGNAFDFDWLTSQSKFAEHQTRLTVKGDVAPASLSALGLDITPYAKGPVALDVRAFLEGTQFAVASVDADFSATDLSLPGDIWRKPQGSEGHASALIYQREGGGWNAQDVRFDGNGAIFRGALDLTQEGEIVDARFSRIMIPNGADISLGMTSGQNGLNFVLRGSYLNLSPSLRAQNVSQRAVNLLDRPLVLSAEIERVTTAPQSTLSYVHADIVRDFKGWRSLYATGQSQSGRSEISLRPEPDGRRSISGVLSDAGFFAQLLYPGAPLFGGTGRIEGELPVVGANSLGTLTFEGKDISFGREGTTPILFDRVQLPMSVQGGIVTLKNGQADGDAYTVKASGYVDLGAGRLDIRGVATPGGLNRALGTIPVFGGLLGGGADEGLLGLTFDAVGSLSAPKLRTNPISVLAPGFLRKIFEGVAPISPVPPFVVTYLAGNPNPTTWPYGPTEDMTEPAPSHSEDQRVGPSQ